MIALSFSLCVVCVCVCACTDIPPEVVDLLEKRLESLNSVLEQEVSEWWSRALLIIITYFSVV